METAGVSALSSAAASRVWHSPVPELRTSDFLHWLTQLPLKSTWPGEQVLSAKLGETVPLETERGYHVTLPHARKPRMPLYSGDHSFAVTPLDIGLPPTFGNAIACRN